MKLSGYEHRSQRTLLHGEDVSDGLPVGAGAIRASRTLACAGVVVVVMILVVVVHCKTDTAT